MGLGSLLFVFSSLSGFLISSGRCVLRCGDPKKQRKFKSAEDVKSKKPERDVDITRPDLKGETGCNACCLYWNLHGVSLLDFSIFAFLKSFKALPA